MKRLLHNHIVINRVRKSALLKHINTTNPNEKCALQAPDKNILQSPSDIKRVLNGQRTWDECERCDKRYLMKKLPSCVDDFLIN